MPGISTASSRSEGSAIRERAAAAARYEQVRAHSLALAAPLSPEDQCIQSMPDASPTKWHLAHTSWFFETLVLQPHARGYRPFDPAFARLFNSYYESLGPRHPRPQRGLLTRPGLPQVHAYRAHVDEAMQAFIAAAPAGAWRQAGALVELGLQHEQQHQELIATDILHALSCNPLLPAWMPAAQPALRLASTPAPLRWLAHPGGIAEVGHAGSGFAFDNETPRHAVLLQPFELADRLVTCGEYLDFIERRRLLARLAVVVRWLGHGAGAGLAGAAVLAGAGRSACARRGLAGVRPVPACSASTRRRR